MPTAFDHLDSFKNLDNETKQAVLKKFNTLSPEDQQTVMAKIGTPPNVRYAEPGLTPIEPVTDTLKKGLESYKANAPQLTDALTESGTMSPTMAKVVGKTFEHIPDIAMAVDSAPSIAKAAVSGAKGAAELAGSATDTLSTKLGGILDALKGTGQKQVAALTEKAAQLPITQSAKAEMAQGLRQAAKTGIQSAEEQAGLGLTNIQGNPKALNQTFAVRAAKLADMGPEALAEKMDSKTLQFMRKTSELGFKQGGADAPLYAKAKKAFTDALGLQQPEIKDALTKYQQIEQVISDLPAQFKKEKQALTLALTKARNLAKAQAPIRKTVQYMAGGGAAAAGYRAIKKSLRE